MESYVITVQAVITMAGDSYRGLASHICEKKENTVNNTHNMEEYFYMKLYLPFLYNNPKEELLFVFFRPC